MSSSGLFLLKLYTDGRIIFFLSNIRIEYSLHLLLYMYQTIVLVLIKIESY